MNGQPAEVIPDRLALAGVDAAAQLYPELGDPSLSASAQRIAIAGPSNADSAPSPMCLTTRPPCSETVRSTSASWRSSTSRHARSPSSAARVVEATMP